MFAIYYFLLFVWEIIILTNFCDCLITFALIYMRSFEVKKKFQVRQDSDGYVLIDRSGKHFEKILNFLREGTVPLPDCRQEVTEILHEAKYYLIRVCAN